MTNDISGLLEFSQCDMQQHQVSKAAAPAQGNETGDRDPVKHERSLSREEEIEVS